jgi:hypothetical protein
MWIIEDECYVSGVWTTPEKAVRAFFKMDATGTVNANSACHGVREGMTVAQVLELVTDPRADYLCLVEVPVDPPDGGDTWTLRR